VAHTVDVSKPVRASTADFGANCVHDSNVLLDFRLIQEPVDYRDGTEAHVTAGAS
jgi:hypothetical protein